MFSGFLDTNVLWPSLQRDFLLSLASSGLYRPLWSEAVLAELHEHELIKLFERGATEPEAATRTEHLLGRMRQVFADAIVTGWEPYEGTYGLPDLDDEHVVAAAVVGGASVIVTDNVRHFPADLLPPSIEVQTGRQFITNTISADPASAATSLIGMAARYRNPTYHPGEVLAELSDRYRLTEVADMITPYLEPSDTRE